MPAPMILRFNDPDEYQTFYERSHGGAAKSTIMTAGMYSMEIAAVNLGSLWVSRSHVSLPRIVYHTYPRALDSISFCVSDDYPPSVINGEEVPSQHVTVAPAGLDAICRSSAELTIANLSIAPDKLRTAMLTLIGHEPKGTQAVRLARQPPQLLSRLRQLHEVVCHFADTVPNVLARSEVARAMEQELLRTMTYCLADHRAPETVRTHRRIPVMRRFEQVIGERPGEPMYLPEICAAVGVTERTLRNHCMRYLGVSPHRYLWLRRMNQVKRALMLADPTTTTVTAVASDHGFWELGRFAVAYRKLFNEPPSTTLRTFFGRSPESDRPELLLRTFVPAY
jgi:AraC-like DNA-binding protein